MLFQPRLSRSKLLTMSAFILAGRKKLPPEPAPSPAERYDSLLQLWVDCASGQPLIECLSHEPAESKYGETSITETREGADQSEGTWQATAYGETTMTKTREGADQSEASSLQASQYGESIHTATREGADQPDRAVGMSSFGETSETRTREGSDQTEITGVGEDWTVFADLSLSKAADPRGSRTLSYAPNPHF